MVRTIRFQAAGFWFLVTMQIFKSLLIFFLTYFHIAAPKLGLLKLDRPSWALVGAVLMVMTGVLTLQEAYTAIDLNTIVLLFGMMVLISYMKLAGFFQVVSYRLQRYARSPAVFLGMLILVSGLLSAFFVNDTVCLMFTPLLVIMLSDAGLPPVPYLIALATSSNIGSAFTLTGNPQNMLIGIFSGWNYAAFALYMLPITFVALLINFLIVYTVYRKELTVPRAQRAFQKPDVDRRLLAKTFAVLAVVFAGFCFVKNLPLVAIAGAVFIIVLADRKPSKAFEKVDWTLLVFFCGLFIVTHGVNKALAGTSLYQHMISHFGRSVAAQVVNLSVVSVIGSNIVSNVPFVMLAAHWIDRFIDPKLMWLVLAMASTFAGNLTLVGSVANLIVAEMAKDTVHVGFREYCKVGILVTVLTTAVGVLMLLGYHAWGVL